MNINWGMLAIIPFRLKLGNACYYYYSVQIEVRECLLLLLFGAD
jgi:hypothetical protein